MENSVIKTAGRVFEILEYFREVRKPLSVRDISEHFEYPLSSTSVLVKSIATLGYLSYDSRIRAYSPTILVAMLGDWIYESSFSSAEIIGLMKALSESTSETVILAVQNDIQAQYVQVIQSRLPIQFYVSPGTRRPLCASGTGWALLAPQSDATIARIHQRTQARIGKGGLPEHMALEDVMAQVKKVRTQGHVYSRGTNTPGVGVIAMPLPATPNGARLVIGIGGLVERLDKSERSIAKRMKEAIAHYMKDAAPAKAKPKETVAARVKAAAPAKRKRAA
ncbi:MAG: yagI [Rhizobacter sp.]|jgi:DNA-binding IclR family transcriptional regulator|nr:yagI [Rhizobacter sp.]